MISSGPSSSGNRAPGAPDPLASARKRVGCVNCAAGRHVHARGCFKRQRCILLSGEPRRCSHAAAASPHLRPRRPRCRPGGGHASAPSRLWGGGVSRGFNPRVQQRARLAPQLRCAPASVAQQRCIQPPPAHLPSSRRSRGRRGAARACSRPHGGLGEPASALVCVDHCPADAAGGTRGGTTVEGSPLFACLRRCSAAAIRCPVAARERAAQCPQCGRVRVRCSAMPHANRGSCTHPSPRPGRGCNVFLVTPPAKSNSQAADLVPNRPGIGTYVSARFKADTMFCNCDILQLSKRVNRKTD